MNGYFYYEGGILKHYRTPGSKNGVSKTPGYTAQGEVAQLTSDGHYASQYGGLSQSQILAKDQNYTGNKVREEDRIMEDARQKIRAEIQRNPAAYAAKQQSESNKAAYKKLYLTSHAKKLRESIDDSDKEKRYRRANRSTLGNVMVDALSDIGSGITKTFSKKSIKSNRGAKILSSYIRSIKGKFKK